MSKAPTKGDALKILAALRRQDPLWYFLGGAAPMANAAQMGVIRSTKLYNAIISGNRGGKSATMAAKIALKLRNIELKPIPKVATGEGRERGEGHVAEGGRDRDERRAAGDGSNGYDFVLSKPLKPRHYLFLCPSRSQIRQIWEQKLLIDSQLGGPRCPKEIAGKGFIPMSEVEKVAYDYGTGTKCPRSILLKNKNEIVLDSVHDIHMWRRIQGVDYDHVFLDEGACSVELLNEIYVRLIDSQAKGIMAGIDWAATNTDPHAYEAYEIFLNRCLSATQGGVEDPDHAVHVLKVEDNPLMTGSVMSRVRRVLGEDEARVRISGVSKSGEYAVFPNFDPAKHVAEKDFLPGPKASVWIGYDPGVAHPTGIMFGFLDPDTPRVLRIWDYRDHKRQPISVDADVIKEVLQGRRIECLVTDPSAGNVVKSGQGSTVRSMLHDELRKRGIEVHQGMRSNFGQSINHMEASIIDVRRWLDEYRVIFSPRCSTAIHQIAKWRFRPKTVFGGMGKPYDKDDEACFPAGTLVLMSDGRQRPIEEICEGDHIMTPFGPQPVRAAGQTGVRLVGATKLSDRILLSTGDHRILSDTWGRADSLTFGQIVHSYRRKYQLDRLLTDNQDPELGRATVSNAAKCWSSAVRVQRPWESLWGQEVYCLAVDAGCFYANGILVSNCDTLRYLVRARPYWIDRGNNLATTIQEGIMQDPPQTPQSIASNRVYEAWLKRQRTGARSVPLFST